MMASVGFGAGVPMRQEITVDPFGLTCWASVTASNCICAREFSAISGLMTDSSGHGWSGGIGGAGSGGFVGFKSGFGRRCSEPFDRFVSPFIEPTLPSTLT